MSRRVVVTGMAGITSLGTDWASVRERLKAGRNGVTQMPGWAAIDGLRTRLGAPVPDFAPPREYPRRKTRTMGRVALMATRASELAFADAGLLGAPVLSSGAVGVSYGSTSGSGDALKVYGRKFFAGDTTKGIAGSDYIKLMSHTCAANLAHFFELRGRVVPTCSACTSGSQGIGYGYEAVKFGLQDVMLTGGAEELGALEATVFDILYATSTRNDRPELTPRPFDTERDGLVVGEGAGALVLEELEHARARGARIYAEVLGYATTCDGKHLTNPDRDGMRTVMSNVLAQAGLGPGDIDYVNGHGTATEAGDVVESHATHDVFGSVVPFGTLKSYIGHTLGACGALEAWMTIEMMREGWFAPNINLEVVDPRCAPLDYIRESGRSIAARRVMSNNFAFGGINTSLIFGRAPELSMS